MSDDIIVFEMSLEIKAVRKELDKLRNENKKLKQIIVDNDLDDEVSIEREITPEEEICIKGIDQILELVRNKVFDSKDIQTYDILHKNLRMIRGLVDDNKKKPKGKTAAELLKLVQVSDGT
jgi:hypothetical protein